MEKDTVLYALDNSGSSCEAYPDHTNLKHEIEGEFNLWSAVLQRAIEDLACKKPSLRRSAAKWFRDESTDREGSFLFVCSILSFNPTELRYHINKTVGNIF